MNIIRNRNIFRKSEDQKGFTLVELMLALFISGLVMTAVVSIYVAQSRGYSELSDISNIQQDLRGALVILPMEIRLAGCDPTESDVPGILAATATAFQFTMDTEGDPLTPSNPDGDVDDNGENITFGFGAGVDNDNNGIVDNGGADWSGTGSLGRNIGAGFQPLADNIEAIEFNYILTDGSTTTAPSNPNDIRTVQVSLLARATNRSATIRNTDTYTTASGVTWDPPDDNFRRRLVVTNIELRNMGY